MLLCYCGRCQLWDELICYKYRLRSYMFGCVVVVGRVRVKSVDVFGVVPGIHEGIQPQLPFVEVSPIVDPMQEIDHP